MLAASKDDSVSDFKLALIVPVVVMSPPVKPAPVDTFVTVPVFAVLEAARSYADLTAFGVAASVSELLFVALLN